MLVTCPTPEMLSDWLGGKLAAEQFESVGEHLEKCESCGRTLDSLESAAASDSFQRRLRCLESTSLSLSDETEDHTPRQLPTGDVPAGALIGSYQLLRLLGTGGMGEVRLARDMRLDRLVALKSPKFTDEHLRRRFVQEAKAAGKLRHPHICAVYDVLEQQGVPYLVLEYIDGCTLDEWLRVERSREEIIEVMAKVARAVGFAHDHQVIHRDLKPSNILIDVQGEPHLMDFGLAKILQDDGHDLTLTQQILGTPAYMAPEQARGDNAAVDARTDVYAIGTILYRLLAGRAPFVGESLLRRIQEEAPLPLLKLDSSLPRDLETICHKAMAKEPADRYASAAAVADDLELWLRGEPIRARRIGRLGHAMRWVRRRARAVAAVLGAALVILLLLGWSMQQSQVARMRTQLEQALLEASDVWEHREELEASLDELQRLDANAATALRARLLQSVRREVKTELNAPRLSPEVSTRVQQQIAWIAARSLESEDELENTFRLRRSRWRPLQRLAAPFANLAELPDSSAQAVEATSAGLLLLGGTPVLLARLDNDAGDIEVEVQFAPPADAKSHDYSLGITWNDRQTLRFAFKQQGARCELSIFQGEERLRSEQFVVVPGHGTRTLRVTTAGGAYDFAVDKHYKVRFYPLTLASRRQLSVTSKWPQRVPLTIMTLHSADAPPTPSALEAGDDLYLQQEWVSARTKYEEFLEQAAAGEVHVEVQFKRGMCSFQLGHWAEAANDLEQVAFGSDNLYQASALCHCWYACRQLKEYDRAAAVYDCLATSVSPLAIAETLSDVQVRRLVDTLTEYSVFPAHEILSDVERTIAIQRVVDLQFRSNSFENRFVLLRMYHALGRTSEALQLGREICAGELPMAQAVTETSWILRELGRPEEALALLDRDIALRPANHGTGEMQLERARVLFSLGRLPEAEAEIDAYDVSHGDSERYRMFGAARLMKGVLRRLAGDEAGAQESWNKGRWTAARGDLTNGLDAAQAFVLEAVASEGTQAQLEAIVGSTLRSTGSDAQGLRNLLANNLQLLMGAVRPALQSERGEAALVDMAFQRQSFRNWLIQPVQLVAHQVMLQSCGDQYLDADFEVIEFLLERMLAELSGRDTASLTAVGGAVAIAWKGFTPDLALGMVSAETRPALAFVFAARYRSKDWKDGERLWEIAGSAAPATIVRERYGNRDQP